MSQFNRIGNLIDLLYGVSDNEGILKAGCFYSGAFVFQDDNEWNFLKYLMINSNNTEIGSIKNKSTHSIFLKKKRWENYSYASQNSLKKKINNPESNKKEHKMGGDCDTGAGEWGSRTGVTYSGPRQIYINPYLEKIINTEKSNQEYKKKNDCDGKHHYFQHYEVPLGKYFGNRLIKCNYDDTGISMINEKKKKLN